MEGSRAQSLILWLQFASEADVSTIHQIKNGHLLQKILSKIDGFYFSTGRQQKKDDGALGWKVNYSRLKGIYQQMQVYMRQSLKVSPPSSLSVMNLVQIAKGESEQGLQTLLHLVFIVCIRCPLKQNFIRCIMKLPNEAQLQLMQIIQDWQIQQQEIKQQNSEITYYKQQLSRLQFLCQNLSSENISLRGILEQDCQKVRRNEEQFMRLQRENEQLMREISERNEQLRARQENFVEKYAQHNEELVQELKRALLEQEQKYSQEILRLKETIYSLQEALAQAKKQSGQLQEIHDRRALLQARDDHPNCISLDKHKSKVNELLTLSKEATQKEIAYKLQNIQVKNLNSELDSKYKKLMEQLRKKQSEFLISTEDASKLKIEFFTRVRDSLKSKFQDYKSKNYKGGEENNIAFLDD